MGNNLRQISRRRGASLRLFVFVLWLSFLSFVVVGHLFALLFFSLVALPFPFALRFLTLIRLSCRWGQGCKMSAQRYI